MENDEILTPKKRDCFASIIITQSICVVLILLTVLVVKYFFKGTYNQAKEWYSQNICVDTDIEQVISDGETDEI